MMRTKAIGIALAAPLAFTLASVMPAHSADKAAPKAEAQKGKNVDAAKRGSTPQIEAAAKGRLADQLARYGDKNKDALALIEAAKIFNEVGVKDEKRDKKTEGTSSAKDEQEGAGQMRDQSVSALLARAREYAGGRKDLIALADEAAKTGTRGAYNPVRHIDRVRAGITDVYNVTFRGGEPAFLAISGDGDTDLDLYVYDQNGNLICASNGPGDDEACRWYPRWTGPFIVRVRNLGGVYNQYRMWSN